MNKISFTKNGTKVSLSSDGVLSLYIKILDWLDKNGYDFKGRIHSQFIRRVFSKEEIGEVISNSKYKLNSFYNFGHFQTPRRHLKCHN